MESVSAFALTHHAPAVHGAMPRIYTRGMRNHRSRKVLFLFATIFVGTSVLAGEASTEAPRHVIYLHGRIVQEQQSPRPRHAEWGHYEFDAIVSALRERGFMVSAEIRPKGTSVDAAADAVVTLVRQMLDSGIDPDRISVLGASMGAAIALRASARLQEPRLRFVVLGPCLAANIPAVASAENAGPVGWILGVREESDIPSSECRGEAPAPFREIVINTGLDHGFLYRPLAEWLEPVTDWMTRVR